MKKLFTICLLAVTMCVVAQEQTQTKRIAILETVDKMDGVPYGVKLQLRQSLTFSITQTPGYEGYSRVDMSSITGEQNFQRTGMVKDEDIKRLGEMTGAAYVLIAEAAPYDDDHIIITANLINVETARVEKATPPEVSKKTPEDMGKSCTLIANILLNGDILDMNSVQHSDNIETYQEASQTTNQNTTQNERDIEKIKKFKVMHIPAAAGAISLKQQRSNGFTFAFGIYDGGIKGATYEWCFIDRNTRKQITETERLIIEDRSSFLYSNCYDILNFTHQDVENTYVQITIYKDGYENASTASQIFYYGKKSKSSSIYTVVPKVKMKKIK